MQNSFSLGIIILAGFMIPNPGICQLSELQKSTLLTYIQNSPGLAKYDKTTIDKVMTGPGLADEVKTCWVDLKKYAALRNSRKTEDLRTMYSELGTGVPDMRDKILPGFMKLDYSNMLEQKPGNDITIDISPHLRLVNYFAAGRQDRLTPKNAFGSMIFLHPELVADLRKAASANINKQADDAKLTLWLEINYWNKMYQDAVRKIIAEEKNIRKELDYCLATLPARFEQAGGKEDLTEQNWNGIFVNPPMNLKFERKGQFAFGSAILHGGGATETVQWNLTVKGSYGEGDWTVVYVDKDKTITRSGGVTAKLQGDILDYEIIGKDWNIKWNEGVKPYPTETKEAIIGIKASGSYKRKN